MLDVPTQSDLVDAIGSEDAARRIARDVIAEWMLRPIRQSMGRVGTGTVIAEQLPAAWLPALPGVRFERLPVAQTQIPWATGCLPLLWIDAHASGGLLEVSLTEGNRCLRVGRRLEFEKSAKGWVRRSPPGSDFTVTGNCPCQSMTVAAPPSLGIPGVKRSAVGFSSDEPSSVRHWVAHADAIVRVRLTGQSAYEDRTNPFEPYVIYTRHEATVLEVFTATPKIEKGPGWHFSQFGGTLEREGGPETHIANQWKPLPVQSEWILFMRWDPYRAFFAVMNMERGTLGIEDGRIVAKATTAFTRTWRGRPVQELERAIRAEVVGRRTTRDR